MAAELRKAGYQVTEGFGGHGVVGLLRNGPGPTVLKGGVQPSEARRDVRRGSNRVRRPAFPPDVGPGSLGWRGAVSRTRDVEPTTAPGGGRCRAATSHPANLSKARHSRRRREDERDTMRPEYDFVRPQPNGGPKDCKPSRSGNRRSVQHRMCCRVGVPTGCEPFGSLPGCWWPPRARLRTSSSPVFMRPLFGRWRF
jgi:hypothetical protein